MLFYAVCLFVFAALEILTGVLTYLGDINVVYDYYIGSVRDVRGYTKALGIATACMAAPAIACGVLFLVKPVLLCSLIGIGIALLGIIGGYVAFYKIQEHFNGGMF
jgi:hypothetical protein